MSDLNLVILQQFTDRMSAEMAKGLLDNAHIPCIITTADAGGARPAPFSYSRFITLSVQAEDLEKAQEAIVVMKIE